MVLELLLLIFPILAIILIARQIKKDSKKEIKNEEKDEERELKLERYELSYILKAYAMLKSISERLNSIQDIKGLPFPLNEYLKKMINFFNSLLKIEKNDLKIEKEAEKSSKKEIKFVDNKLKKDIEKEKKETDEMLKKYEKAIEKELKIEKGLENVISQQEKYKIKLTKVDIKDIKEIIKCLENAKKKFWGKNDLENIKRNINKAIGLLGQIQKNLVNEINMTIREERGIQQVEKEAEQEKVGEKQLKGEQNRERVKKQEIIKKTQKVIKKIPKPKGL